MSVKNRFSILMREAGYYRFSRRIFLKSLAQVFGGLALFWKVTSRKGRPETGNAKLPGIPFKKLPEEIPGPNPELLG